MTLTTDQSWLDTAMVMNTRRFRGLFRSCLAPPQSEDWPLAEIGFYREVRMKGYDRWPRGAGWSRSRPSSPTGSAAHEDVRADQSAKQGGKFETDVRRLVAGQEELAPIALPLLVAWLSMRVAAELGQQLVANARHNEACSD